MSEKMIYGYKTNGKRERKKNKPYLVLYFDQIGLPPGSEL